MNQYEILSKVLGERSDYQRGVGYRGKARKTASSSSSQSGASSHHARSQFSDEDMAAVVNMIQALRDVNPQSQLLQSPAFDQVVEMIGVPGSSSQGAAASSSSPAELCKLCILSYRRLTLLCGNVTPFGTLL